ncbi:DUF2982 domain-containing protein [Alteromonas halophila]|uniref:DUF2982 domain-containing protein n=1 Tax=Alteromonas halophila TaxID=516698 RepID=A0A918JFT3_9ALTE|nr:DUF2982 domain-containing protein [Alteromonas halophila]GGW78707.1 hypothetical protein GCM10007391_09170 [Alteromonas halophila]
MSSDASQPILIRATSKRNGITSVIIGLAGVLLSMLWFALTPDWLFLAGVFLTSASIVALLIGYFKLREPEHSIEISPDVIHYQHRLGNWMIDWENVQRVDCPRVRHGIEHVDLETIGIRIKEYGPFLKSVSPRLATHLLMEQRPLLFQNKDENCPSGSCYEQSMFDDKHFTLPDGEVFTGIKAMLANRMMQLRERLGFDVYVSASELDRTPGEFVSLLRDCQQARIQSTVKSGT